MPSVCPILTFSDVSKQMGLGREYGRDLHN